MVLNPGLAGFQQRPFAPGDPIVCPLCALTLGARISDDVATEASHLAALEEGHEDTCKQRRAVQRAARGYARPAVPIEVIPEAVSRPLRPKRELVCALCLKTRAYCLCSSDAANDKLWFWRDVS